jgi:hypothetical protein
LYDLSVLADEITGVDLLFVDGPVGDTSPQARYPALPVLADRLTDDTLVLLDDSNRGSRSRSSRCGPSKPTAAAGTRSSTNSTEQRCSAAFR